MNPCGLGPMSMEGEGSLWKDGCGGGGFFDCGCGLGMLLDIFLIFLAFDWSFGGGRWVYGCWIVYLLLFFAEFEVRIYHSKQYGLYVKLSLGEERIIDQLGPYNLKANNVYFRALQYLKGTNK